MRGKVKLEKVYHPNDVVLAGVKSAVTIYIRRIYWGKKTGRRY